MLQPVTCGAGAQVFVQHLFSVRRLLRAAGTSLRFLLVVLSDEDASLNLAWSFKSPASARAHTVPLFFLWVTLLVSCGFFDIVCTTK